MWWVVLGVLLAVTPAWARQQPAPAGRPARAGAAVPTVESPEERLARARQAYLSNEFTAAIELAAPLLYPDVKLRREEDVIRAHRLLALSYFLNQQRDESKREFLALLALQPDFALDPVLDPPPALAFLEDIKARERQRIEEIERGRREAAEAAAREEERRRREEEARRIEELRRTLEPRLLVVQKNRRWLSLLPLGIGQVQNGQTGKAIAFGFTQAALGISSLAMWTAIQVRYDFGRIKAPQHTDEEKAETERWKRIQIASVVTGGLFWADVGWGIIDALVHFKPQVVLDGAPAPAPAPRTSLAPFVPSGGGAGLSIQGAF